MQGAKFCTCQHPEGAGHNDPERQFGFYSASYSLIYFANVLAPSLFALIKSSNKSQNIYKMNEVNKRLI